MYSDSIDSRDSKEDVLVFCWDNFESSDSNDTSESSEISESSDTRAGSGSSEMFSLIAIQSYCNYVQTFNTYIYWSIF